MTSCDACLAPDGQSKSTASSQGEPQGLLHEMHEVLEGAAPLPRETLLAQAITRSGASWPASRAPAGDESRRRSHHASALQIQVSSSALPHQIACSSIFSLPPDCTRAATVTVSESSEHLHVIAVLVDAAAPLLLSRGNEFRNTSPPRTIAQKASSLVGPRSRGSKLVYCAPWARVKLVPRHRSGQNRVLINRSHAPIE